MARNCRLLYPEQDAAAQVAALIGAMKPKRKRGVNVDRVRAELEIFLAADRYETMKPIHLVALWARCHERVYGVVPSELAGDAWLAAASAAGKLVRVEFGGDMGNAVEFLRWTWRREQGREIVARKRKDDRVSRIGWRLQFAQRYLLTDYRLDLARRAAP